MAAPEISPDACVLYEDDYLLAAAKPAGWETVVKGTQGKCFTSALRRAGGYAYLQPVHRLDRDTSGVQLFARSKDAQGVLEEAFRHRTMRKQYLALCLGVPRNASGTIRRNLSPWKAGRRPVQVVKKGGLEAETTYRLLAEGMAEDTPVSLLLFSPHQGRTHQIRVHAEAFGRPILGDDNYGDRNANRQLKTRYGLARQALHAWRIAFSHPVTKAALCLDAPLPDDLQTFCDAVFPAWAACLEKVDADADA